MMQLEIDEPERQLLVGLVQEDHAETHAEIHHAMDHTTREDLKQRRMLLAGLLTKLGAALPKDQWAA